MPSLLRQAASGISSDNRCWQGQIIIELAAQGSAIRAVVWKGMGHGGVVMANTSSLTNK